MSNTNEIDKQRLKTDALEGASLKAGQQKPPPKDPCNPKPGEADPTAEQIIKCLSGK